ncbi:unnamed protein product [Blepharisma stoltei]|uniref:Uncharacterized protein n=1 Tax=Blepharisma stoltei TaxID=1481888 RepID=A0AAU9IH51_9CILI|nr:unnamed protein product [Blepharisma stoltei]
MTETNQFDLIIRVAIGNAKPKNAKYYSFSAEKFHQDFSQLSSEKALSRLKPLNDLGQEYQNIYLPALPCHDLVLISEEEQSPFGPWTKDEDGIQLFLSGKRSAIFNHENQLIRLKGCGNLNYGFNVEPMPYPPEGKEIRGCCFENTGPREQFMTWHINEVLSNYGFKTGNLPYGLWEYQNDNLSQIKKFCGIFQTFGDRRLATHLLGGADKLLNEIEIYCDHEKLSFIFPNSRKIGNKIESTQKQIKNTGPLFHEDLHIWTSQGVYKDNSALLNILVKDPDFEIFENFDLDLGNGRIVNAKCIARDLAKIFWKIGREAGQIKRILEDHDISWGYFIDHNPFEPHCNSHPNNFIILPSGSEHILAPVDFDMAFRSQEFLNIVDENSLGRNDSSLFQNWLNCERVNLELALSGQENMANFSYSEEASESILHSAYRDLLVLGYRSGFDKLEDAYNESRAHLESAIFTCLAFTQEVDKY